MPGRGPLPKAQARRTARPTHDTIHLPAEGRTGRAPKPIFELSEAETALWRLLWSTPMATQWTTGDTFALSRLVKLVADPATLEKAPLLAEVRQLEDRLGLTPEGRLKLRWEVSEEPIAPPRVGEVVALARGRGRDAREVYGKAGPLTSEQ